MDFSIITPSYNYGRYIAECLNSVAEQDGVTLEHLVMDAGSTDGTNEIVTRFPHAQFFQESDKGMSDGINKGFRRAIGKWVMWLNADDSLKPGVLKTILNYLEEDHEADVVYGDWEFVDGAGRMIRPIHLFPFDRGMLLYLGCYIGSTATFFRRTTTIDQGHILNVKFRYVMDGEYYLRLDSLKKNFRHIAVTVANFRIHGENLSLRNWPTQSIDEALAMQYQYSEARAIRMAYGTRWFKNDNLNCGIDGLIQCFFLVKKYIKRRIADTKFKNQPLT